MSKKKKLIVKGEVSDISFKDELIASLIKNTDKQVIDSIEVLPSPKLGKSIYAIVNLSVCNIRSKPDHPAELATQALMGTPVKIYKELSGWYLIQTPDEYLGWVDEDGIELKNAKEMQEWISSKKIIYRNFFGFVYGDENFEKVISDAVAGNLFEKLNQTENYFEVKLPDGRNGFIKIEEATEFNEWFKNLSFNSEKSLISVKK